ncbi:tripartite tricarboxylate transporter TctB family protein, partial [Micrococcus endophyticus]
VEVVRVRQAPEGQADADGEVGQAAGPLTLFHSDFGALAWCFLGFLAFAVLLPWLGWILAGALLFWCITRAFGAPHPLFDILVALFVSSLAYLGFAVALGLTLPSGILGGGF